jgi:site-specific DNA-methyltransferase (adenine-specific)
MEVNKIYNMDCLEGMKILPNDFVDITITSPPYNIGSSIHHNKNMYLEYNDNLNDKEYTNFIINVVSEMLRVTKNYVFFNFQILSNNKKSYIDIIHHFKNNIKEFFIWAKPNPAPGVQPGLFANGFEFIICLSKWDNDGRTFKLHYTQQGKKSNTIIQKTNKEFIVSHFACFGKWLPKFFIDCFSKENDIVLDPFMGSGTTAIACKELNRHFIGFEISKEYCDIANKRLDGVPERISNWLDDIC